MLGVDAGELRSTVLFKERLDLGRESGSALFTEDCSDFLQRQFLFGSRCRCLRLCINSGRKTSFYRTDFLGVMDEKKLPEWAQKGLEKAKEMHAQEKKPAKERGDAR